MLIIKLSANVEDLDYYKNLSDCSVVLAQEACFNTKDLVEAYPYFSFYLLVGGDGTGALSPDENTGTASNLQCGIELINYAKLVELVATKSPCITLQ
ncbi:hypothetical protein ISG33_05470 [Glaciecola sp. MH2013]|uniref:hypothetical protein n=1 Tax=Glaciecola sp. MH2013 TaxID=2785524 RepID=UPI00189D67EC|nr:hypothetical protein [Glaciecola sp. MH2013]MBF7072847.1 hypothetical protein [Glaciecola sp. MH2013]